MPHRASFGDLGAIVRLVRGLGCVFLWSVPGLKRRRNTNYRGCIKPRVGMSHLHVWAVGRELISNLKPESQHVILGIPSIMPLGQRRSRHQSYVCGLSENRVTGTTCGYSTEYGGRSGRRAVMAFQRLATVSILRTKPCRRRK
jgi:hypothetical protein